MYQLHSSIDGLPTIYGYLAPNQECDVSKFPPKVLKQYLEQEILIQAGEERIDEMPPDDILVGMNRDDLKRFIGTNRLPLKVYNNMSDAAIAQSIRDVVPPDSLARQPAPPAPTVPVG